MQFSEIAGLTTDPPPPSAAGRNNTTGEQEEEDADEPQLDVEGILVIPLVRMLACMRIRTGTNRLVLIFTLQEHTRMVLSDGGGPLWLFDPLEDRLSPLCASTMLHIQAQLRLPPRTIYAGILLSDTARI